MFIDIGRYELYPKKGFTARNCQKLGELGFLGTRQQMKSSWLNIKTISL